MRGMGGNAPQLARVDGYVVVFTPRMDSVLFTSDTTMYVNLVSVIVIDIFVFYTRVSCIMYCVCIISFIYIKINEKIKPQCCIANV